MTILTTANPMILDTTAGLVTNNPIIIKSISFQGSADFAEMVLKDKTNTNTVWSTKLGTVATSGHERSINFGDGIPVKGLYLNTITNGIVLVYT